MTIRPRLLLLTGWLCGLLLAGCGTTSPSPTATPTPTGPDFTQPGAASAMVTQLLEDAGSQRALTVEITKTTVEVTVLNSDELPVAWAYRDGTTGRVTTDQQYVDQATFDVSRFNISDVGGLFRAAEGQSGSASNQSLTIVDYSGGEVMMSVSTVPESRTVFFNASGSILQTLNFDTSGGVEAGIKDALGPRLTVYSITVDSTQGVTVDYPGATGTTVRRTRTAKVPVTTNVAVPAVDLPVFLATKVEPARIVEVVDRVRASEDIADDVGWSVVIDDRRNLGVPRMYFSIGTKVLVTDVEGNEVIG
ncbi:MAG: hypothetical protein QM779_09075 [Propionicimonas sp.]|uniref:hypothetical protein n=1 Tax=Propionicimonas sp. TaxID=1955623 RepID=UPI003D0F1EC9